MQKSERVFTFSVNKNQLPFFFLCAKYGPKVNTISREYDKRVQQSFLFETRSLSSTEDRELLNQNLSKNESLNLFTVQILLQLRDWITWFLPSRACSSNLQWKEKNSCCEELSQSAVVLKSLWAFISELKRQSVCWKERSQDKSTRNSSHSRNEILICTFDKLFENQLKMALRFIQCNQDFNMAYVKLHNSCALGLGMSRNVSGVSNALLQQRLRWLIL